MFFVLLTGVLGLAILTVLLWARVRYSWLGTTARVIVLTLPFERIPSLSVGGSTLRFSQLATLVGFYFLAILLVRQDSETLRIRLGNLTWFLLGFLVLGIPSYFAVIDYARFYVTFAGVLFAFGACWFVAHFAKNISTLLSELVLVLFGCGLFAIYQVGADLVGVPLSLTFLSVEYSKEVFGIARAQGTALEPLYFAGMMFLPLMYGLFHILAEAKPSPVVLPFFEKPARWFLNRPLLVFGFFAGILFLTYSKAALALAGLGVGVVLLQALRRFSLKKIWARFWPFTATGIGLVWAVFLYVERARSVGGELWTNLVDTLLGTSPSSTERLLYLQTGLDFLRKTPLLGIGSGQFGVVARAYLQARGLGLSRTQYLIVNNVYVEVWLEFGLFSALVFYALLGFLLWRGLRRFWAYRFDRVPGPELILTLTLCLYAGQWLTFSPIFIMPIFILLGLLYRTLTVQEDIF